MNIGKNIDDSSTSVIGELWRLVDLDVTKRTGWHVMGLVELSIHNPVNEEIEMEVSMAIYSQRELTNYKT